MTLDSQEASVLLYRRVFCTKTTRMEAKDGGQGSEWRCVGSQVSKKVFFLNFIILKKKKHLSNGDCTVPLSGSAELPIQLVEIALKLSLRLWWI